MLIKTQDMGYILQKLQNEKKGDVYLKTKIHCNLVPKGASSAGME
jgi:hypothetical protein